MKGFLIMSNIAVVYWSGTGNTEAMAQAVLAGIQEGGAHGELFTPSEFDNSMLTKYDALAFGCPAMGAEELEDGEFKPMFTSLEDSLGGKKIALFGSYGWGDGTWMENWEDSCREAGAVLACNSVICCEAPDADAEQACRALGKALI